MEYLAHVEGERKQSVKEHLYGTAKLAGDFAGRFGKKEWGYCCGMLHDIGKYSDAFQERIRNKSNRLVDHATAGAKVCLDQGGCYSFLKLLHCRPPCRAAGLWKFLRFRKRQIIDGKKKKRDSGFYGI